MTHSDTPDGLSVQSLETKYAAHLSDCIGFEVPDGWLELVSATLCLLTLIQPDIQIAQVKTKMGLTIYANNDQGYATELIRNVFRASHRVCQGCGLPGKLEGWNVWCERCPVATGGAK